MYAKIMGAAALGLMVAACGTDPQERVQGGAAAGAATGAGVGALGGPVGALAGAAIGGGAGAITGATTSPRDVNLGRPVWENPETRVPGVSNTSARGSASQSSTRQAQQALASRGYNPGPADGIMGDRTRQATMDFQRANNIEPSGRLDTQTMAALNVSAAGSTGTRSRMSDRDRAYMGGGMVSQTNPDRSGTATDADPGTGGTGGSGGSTPSTPPGGLSGQPSFGNPNPTMPGPAGGRLERSGTATGADPGAGGTGGSGGGASGAPIR